MPTAPVLEKYPNRRVSMFDRIAVIVTVIISGAENETRSRRLGVYLSIDGIDTRVKM
ncbi:hypothetical protein GCM10009039_33870 [Halocalculus aciditolerans]|uniref:Uncharacterized protein n=1 Tax=Halocalculus aciditolerans TaxID=1383812 RepID=A0A830FNG8_9EURY|nr:hypothetical protein GCM10009039_33870 [Halocalculus aciditolerans]